MGYCITGGHSRVHSSFQRCQGQLLVCRQGDLMDMGSPPPRCDDQKEVYCHSMLAHREYLVCYVGSIVRGNENRQFPIGISTRFIT